MTIFKMDNLHTVLFDEKRDSSDITKQLLQQADIHHTRHLQNIDDAYEICFRMTIDIIFVDMDNKNGHGHKLVRKLRKAASSERLNTRIIALIGTKDQDIVLEAASCGVDLIIMKPIAASAIQDRVIKVHQMKVNYVRFEDYFGPDRRLMPDRLPEGEADKRSDSTEI